MDSTRGHPRTLLVYKSVHHQNTANVAREIAGVLGAECVVPTECPYSRLAGCELLGIGSGVYYGRPHDEILQWVRGLPEERARDLPVFIFTTSGLPFLAKLWHAPLRTCLAKKGFEIVGEFACRGFDTWGPLWLTGGLNWAHPDKRDLVRARQFVERVVKAVHSLSKSGRGGSQPRPPFLTQPTPDTPPESHTKHTDPLANSLTGPSWTWSGPTTSG